MCCPLLIKKNCNLNVLIYFSSFADNFWCLQAVADKSGSSFNKVSKNFPYILSLDLKNISKNNSLCRMGSNNSEQELKKFLSCALSISPSDTIVAKLFGKLKDLGVKEVDDLALVNEDDLVSLRDEGFSIIQIRKVRRAYEGNLISL